jgi:hypothetical protein
MKSRAGALRETERILSQGGSSRRVVEINWELWVDVILFSIVDVRILSVIKRPAINDRALK